LRFDPVWINKNECRRSSRNLGDEFGQFLVDVSTNYASPLSLVASFQNVAEFCRDCCVTLDEEEAIELCSVRGTGIESYER